MVERILSLIKERGLNENTVTRDLDLGKGIFTQWKSGRARPNTDTILKLATYFDVSTDWLLTGKNSIASQTQENKTEKENTRMYRPNALRLTAEDLKEMESNLSGFGFSLDMYLQKNIINKEFANPVDMLIMANTICRAVYKKYGKTVDIETEIMLCPHNSSEASLFAFFEWLLNEYKLCAATDNPDTKTFNPDSMNEPFTSCFQFTKEGFEAMSSPFKAQISIFDDWNSASDTGGEIYLPITKEA